MDYLNSTVSKPFRVNVQGRYGAAFEDKGHARLLQHVFRVADSAKPTPLSSVFIGQLYGQVAQAKAGNLNTSSLLAKFESATKIDLKLTRPQWRYGVARTINPLLPHDLPELLWLENRQTPEERGGGVDFIEGKPRGEAQRRESVKQSATLMQEYADPERLSFPVLSYFASVPPNRFAKYRPRASHLIAQYREQGKSSSSTLANLQAIWEDPRGLYLPAPSCDRVFQGGRGIQTLSSRVRHALQPNGYSADLQNFQVCAAAYDWGIPSLVAALETGESFWAVVARALSLTLTPELKHAFKKTVYPLLYGMDRNHAQGQLTTQVGQDTSRAFFKLPLIQDLLSARDDQGQRIRQAGGVKGVDGRWWNLEHPRDVPRLMSYRMMNIEAALIAEPYKWALEHPDAITITAHTFDGFTFEPRRSDRPSRVRQLAYELKRVVQIKGERLGIPARLIIEDPGM